MVGAGEQDGGDDGEDDGEDDDGSEDHTSALHGNDIILPGS